MQRIIYVGIGGSIGAVIRYLVTKQSANLFNSSIPINIYKNTALYSVLIIAIKSCLSISFDMN